MQIICKHKQTVSKHSIEIVDYCHFDSKRKKSVWYNCYRTAKKIDFFLNCHKNKYHDG